MDRSALFATSRLSRALAFGLVIALTGACSQATTSKPLPSATTAVAEAPAAPTIATAPAPLPETLLAPMPLLSAGHPVQWWFVFKFNTAAFPACGGGVMRICMFGGTLQSYRLGYGQQYVYASSDDETLKKGSDCLGDTTADPLGATYDEVYNGNFYYVVWNDQFYGNPKITGCSKSCSAPWGHSKGLLAWNDEGEGFVMQVTTPDWPGSGSRDHPRTSEEGNTLGCTADDNVLVSQHFFALELTKDDLVKVLHALSNASVVTDTTNPQAVRNGGPADVQALVNQLGVKSTSDTPEVEMLSSGIELISKPSKLHVPPWQLVSAELGGMPLRVASWWARPKIPSTDATTPIDCWTIGLGRPGAVRIAITGQWQGTVFGLKGGLGRDYNHAKVGVSMDTADPDIVFGDMNQQGTLSGTNCASSQNGRGGLFYVIRNPTLAASISTLLKGESAPIATN